MAFREFRKQVKDSVREALEGIGLTDIDFEPAEPPRPEFGDLSISVAFSLSKMMSSNPMDLVNKLKEIISLSNLSLVQDCFVQTPGYLNFRVSYPEFVFRTISQAMNDQMCGVVDVEKGRTVSVEHTSVNPNKALHVGHLRNLVLGDSISRILKFTGSDVKILNYVDDSGLQVADIIVGFLYANFPYESPGDLKFDHYVGDTVYVRVNEMYHTNKSLYQKQKEVLRSLDEPHSKISKLARELTTRILREQLVTCWRIGAKYDLINRESDILSAMLWNQIFEILKEKKIVEHVSEGRQKGCWVVAGEGEGDTKVLVRSDGTATYIAKDIPYAAWKLGLIKDPFKYTIFADQPDDTSLWSTDIKRVSEGSPKFSGLDLAVTVIDVTQSRLQRIISQILFNLGGEDAKNRYIHLGYEIVSLSQTTAEEMGFHTGDEKSVRMSGRKGLYINADDVLDALHEKAYDETKSRNSNESNDWLNLSAERVAVAAMRFELLKQDLEKPITFDLKRSLDLNGETGPYIQYAHARASRILEKVGEIPVISPSSAKKLSTDSEKSLLKEISKFDLIVEEAAKNYSPKVIARYCYTLGALFNIFYEKNPVLSTDDKDTRSGRLALVKAFENTIKIGLGLLGIDAPDRI